MKNFSRGDALGSVPRVIQALDEYSDLLAPWSRSVASVMVADVARRDERSWIEHGRDIGRSLRQEILSAPTGQILQTLMDEQVRLITSLPREAADRVHRLAIQATHEGTRHEDLISEIMRTGSVTESRARLIARTEVSRASSNLLEARAMHVGSDGYIWRTSDDGDVRPSHRKMEGKFVRWGEPPTLDKLTGHAGCLPNCRCWAEPVLPDFV